MFVKNLMIMSERKTFKQQIIEDYGKPVAEIEGTISVHPRSNVAKMANRIGVPCFAVAGARGDKHFTAGYRLYFYSGEYPYAKKLSHYRGVAIFSGKLL